MEWRVEVLDERVAVELEALSADLRAKFVRIAKLLESFGPHQVREPHVKPLGDKLWEMRMAGRDGIARAIYLAAHSQRLVVVHVDTPINLAKSGSLWFHGAGMMEEAMGQLGFFDLPDHLKRLSEAGDPLEEMARVIDFEAFRPSLEAALAYGDGAKGGRPPYDPVAMFKVLILAAQNNVSDGRMEFLIRDRLSWLRFLGFELGQPTPDENTIRSFRERLTRADAIRPLFELFDQQLRAKGYLAMGGQIVDASLISAPRQRNTQAEKEAIKAGKTARQIWPEHPNKAAQKDTDARWTVKITKPKDQSTARSAPELAIPVFGYKSHVVIDRRFGFIRTFRVTDAARHEGRLLRDLVSTDNTASDVWADTAYRSQANETWLAARGRRSQIHHKKPKGRPMPRLMARANVSKSAVRARIEHVFAHQKNRMGLFIRTIGQVRAEAKIGLTNLAYNLQRFLFHQRKSMPA